MVPSFYCGVEILAKLIKNDTEGHRDLTNEAAKLCLPNFMEVSQTEGFVW